MIILFLVILTHSVFALNNSLSLGLFNVSNNTNSLLSTKITSSLPDNIKTTPLIYDSLISSNYSSKISPTHSHKIETQNYISINSSLSSYSLSTYMPTSSVNSWNNTNISMIITPLIPSIDDNKTNTISPFSSYPTFSPNSSLNSYITKNGNTSFQNSFSNKEVYNFNSTQVSIYSHSHILPLTSISSYSLKNLNDASNYSFSYVSSNYSLYNYSTIVSNYEYSITPTSISYSSLSRITNTSYNMSNYINNTATPSSKHHRIGNPFRIFSYKSPCSNSHSEIAQDMVMGWKGTTGTGFGWVVADMISDLKNNLDNSGGDAFMATTQRGGLKCGVWSGAMVSNSDTFSNLLDDMRSTLSQQDISQGRFFEYVSNDKNPMKGFGIYCQNSPPDDDVANAIKGWSEGKSATFSVKDISGTWDYGKKSLCYVDYNSRKSGNNPHDIGNCNYVSLNSGQTASSACNVPGDSLSYYNPGIDFSSLNTGDMICCSTGSSNIDSARTYDCKGDSRLTINLEMGWQNTNTNTDIGWVIADMVSDIMSFYQKNPSSFTSFTERNQLKCAAWAGAMVNIVNSIDSILPIIRNNLRNEGLPDGKYFEYISPDNNPMKIFGVYCTINGRKQDLQNAVKGWSQGISASSSVSGISGTWPINHHALCFTSYSSRRQGNSNNDPNIGQCNYVRIKDGQSASDSCKGLTGDVLGYYNHNLNINQIQPNQPICCSIGDIPDFRPHKNSDGSCFTHEFSDGEGCSSIMAQYYPLSIDDLMKFNKQTFGWYGCEDGHPWKGDKICLSEGTPPRPSVNPLAECGPQAPGDKYNAECPLNACCSEFGFCGFDKEFCGKKSSKTGAPGTAGCLSNCDDVSFNSYSNTWENIAYFDGTKDKDLSTYDGEYDAIHLAFADITNDHNSINVLNLGNSYKQLSSLTNTPKKVLSIGGWDFSTGSSTYNILRDAISNDYDHFANVVVSFMQQSENSFLTGIDIDWEYPGEPDIPGIPADDNPNTRKNYVEFVKAVRLRMDNSKTLSMAIPSSYWYLKNFDIKGLSEWVDYFVFMTYDLHGQWDYSEKYSGGPFTRCHTDMIETESALKMIVKAGVPENKIRVGIANYARTYKLVNSDCQGDGCEFTGPSSGAEAGYDTKTPGILSIDEIRELVNTGHRNTEFDNSTSKCTYLRYDNNQWAAWSTNNEERKNQYRNWGFGGSSLWAANYEKGSSSNNDGNDNNDDNDEEEFESGKVAALVFKELISNTCWNKYKDLDDETQFNSTNECIVDASLALLLNKAKQAINYLIPLVDGGSDHDDYMKDYKGYSSYFAHNMSHAYQEWSYSNIDKDDWFSCLNDKGNSVTCLDAYNSNYKAPCYQNCCPNIGCSKKGNDGKTIEDTNTEQGACHKDSVMDSCCTSSSYFNTKKRSIKSNLNKFKRETNIHNIISNQTSELLSNGFYDYLSPYKNLNEYISMRMGNDDITISGWEVTSADALIDFSKYVGYNVNASEMYTQSFYRFQKPQRNDNEHICYSDQHNNITVRCYDLPKDQLFNRDPLNHINIGFLNNISDVITNIYNNIENKDDYHDDILEKSASSLSNIIDIHESVIVIRKIGHNYNERCERLRVMEVIGPLLAVLSVLSFFLGPVPALITDLSLTVIGIAVDPDHDPLSIVLQLVGSLTGIFGIIGKVGPGRFSNVISHVPFLSKTDVEIGRIGRVIKSKFEKKGCAI